MEKILSQLSGKLKIIELVIGIKGVIVIDKTEELMCRALIIGEKYGQADKPTKIEVGRLMTSKRRAPKRKKSKKKKAYRYYQYL
ncbi:hypothetical protein [Clostridium tertium]|uniref:hypothetical protein n=1 Tax=Clostridium tertium TaxID=1559 RepID=UPI00232FC598|nr:hypothetical protein [Clostridium tertium]MDB1962378.1 hypothetical protein [Clostridium tertium]